MHPRTIKKLRHLNPEFNCDTCLLKFDEQCHGEEETMCPRQFAGVEVIRRRQKTTEPAPEPEILCGQGRCWECPEVLC